MKKLVLAILIAIIVIANSVLINPVRAETTVNGIITSDVTWTKANSPYTFQGPVAVDRGVTLTIESGISININNYYLQVNGTLIARGTNNDRIMFTAANQDPNNPWLRQARIDFTTAGSNSMLENVIFPDFISVSASILVSKCIVPEVEIKAGTPTISDCSITKLTISDGSPLIRNNDITGEFTQIKGTPTINANTIHSKPWTRGGSPTFIGNKLYDGIDADSSGGQITIANNEISSSGTSYVILIVGRVQAVVSNNKITGVSNVIGIGSSGILSSVTITQNQISGCNIAINLDMTTSEVTKNTLTNNSIGLNLVLGPAMAQASGEFAKIPYANVHDNTILQNSIGLQITPYEGSQVNNNNIYDNSKFDLKLQSASDYTIANNYWGTTDTAAISQKIFDFKNDFNLGHVTVTPVLSQPVSQFTPNFSAPVSTLLPIVTLTPIPVANTATPGPTQNNPTSTTNQPTTGIPFDLSTTELAILGVLIIIAALLVILIVTLRGRGKK